jgi:hypothetical protein
MLSPFLDVWGRPPNEWRIHERWYIVPYSFQGGLFATKLKDVQLVSIFL